VNSAASLMFPRTIYRREARTHAVESGEGIANKQNQMGSPHARANRWSHGRNRFGPGG